MIPRIRQPITRPPKKLPAIPPAELNHREKIGINTVGKH